MMKTITVAGVILLASNLLMAQKKNSLPLAHAHSRTLTSEKSVGSGAVVAVLNQRSSSTASASELSKIEHEAPMYQSQKPANRVRLEPLATTEKNKRMARIQRPRSESAGLVTQPRSNGRSFYRHR